MGARFLNNPLYSAIETQLVSKLSTFIGPGLVLSLSENLCPGCVGVWTLRHALCKLPFLKGFPSFYGPIDIDTQQHGMMQAWVH